MKKQRPAGRRIAVLCAAALVLLPLGTGAGRIEDLTGVAYVVEGQTPVPIQNTQKPAQNTSSGQTSSGKLNSLVEDGVIRVSDLERVADQIAYIHQGRLLFQRDKDELLEDTAILRCAAGDIDRLPKELVLARHSGPAGAAALVRHPGEVRRLLPGAVIDRAGIDEMMQFIAGRDAQ